MLTIEITSNITSNKSTLKNNANNTSSSSPDNQTGFHSTHKVFHGFTVIDLLITLAIMSLLFASAVPNMDSIIAKLESQHVAREVYQSLQVARQHAVTSGKTVSICGSSRQGRCLLKDFDHIQVFLDNNRNKQRDDDEELITLLNLDMRGSLRLNAHTALKYQSNGSSYTPASFIYCPGKSIHKPFIKRITVSFSGRVYVASSDKKGIVRNTRGHAIQC